MRRKKKKTPAEPERVAFGYARVSTDDQDLRMQTEALAQFGIPSERIFSDKKSGRNLGRVGLQDMLSLMRGGDMLVVWRLDRLSRSLRDLLDLCERLKDRGIELKSLTEPFDTTTPMGNAMFQLIGVFAEVERRMGAERTKAGMATARARGMKPGPDPVLTEAKLQRAIAALRAGKSVKEVAKRAGVANVTLREKVLKATGGEALWPPGPRTRAKAKRRT